MAKLTYSDAERISSNNRPWTLRLEYQGTNQANQSGYSSKYWYATGRGQHEMVEVGWGKVGSKSQTMLLAWDKVWDKVDEKLTKGYVYAATPHIRMSAANLAKCGTVTAPATSAVKTASSMTPVKRTSKPAPVTAPVAPTAKAHSQASLGAPWSLIVKLKAVRQGTTLVKWDGIDAAGDHVLDFTADSGRDFAGTHNLEIELL